MPNGGVAICRNCRHFKAGAEQEEPVAGLCSLRHVKIEMPFWTSCRNIAEGGDDVLGPLYSVVCEVRDGGGTYYKIPYFDGARVETEQEGVSGKTVVRFTDEHGGLREFESVSDYFRFFEKSGREL